MRERQCRRRPSPNGWTLTWAGWLPGSETCTRTCAMDACSSDCWRFSQENNWSVLLLYFSYSPIYSSIHVLSLWFISWFVVDCWLDEAFIGYWEYCNIYFFQPLINLMVYWLLWPSTVCLTVFIWTLSLICLLCIPSLFLPPQPKPTKGRMRIHCLENVDKALQFLKEQKVHLENMGSHDIVDGNHRLTLGLIWTIILRFQVRCGGSVSSRRLGQF